MVICNHMRCCLVVVVAVVSFSWSSWCARMSAWVFFSFQSLPYTDLRSPVFGLYGLRVFSCGFMLAKADGGGIFNRLKSSFVYILLFFCLAMQGILSFFFACLAFLITFVTP